MQSEMINESNSKLVALIKQEIQSQGPMSFARFMEHALYAPDLGYYTASLEKLGRKGDFVTAPELSSLFSRCVARQCAQVIAVTSGDILEFGAGSGVMAVAILKELESLGALPEHYFILEVSNDLKIRQQALISALPSHLSARVNWLDSLPAAFNGVILANEVLDAFPVHRFTTTDRGYREWYVSETVAGFQWTLDKPQFHVESYLDSLELSLPRDYESECNLLIPSWIKNIGTSLHQGAVFIMDYGFPRQEFYHPDRNTGTLMCHHQHRAHADPLILVGQQDITAHVDFTLVAEMAQASGLTVAGYTNQANFLLGCGITDFLSSALPQEVYCRLTNEIKMLTSPNEMGELFKVMALTKNCPAPLMGFSLRDLLYQL